MKLFVFVVLIICSNYGQTQNLDDVSSSSTSSTTESAKLSVLITEQEVASTLATINTHSLDSRTESTSVNTSTQSIESAIEKKLSNKNISFVDNLSNQIRLVLKHFQKPDPIGIPGDDILPEPMPAADVNASFVVADGHFSNISVLGLNNFSINVVQTFLDQMEVFVIIKLKNIVAFGNYSLSSFFINDNGPFNITFYNVTAAGNVSLATDTEGKLYANKSAIDIAYEAIDVNLTNVSSVVRPFLNTGGDAVFQAEKSFILESINQRLISEINRRLEIFPKIPSLSTLSPVDLAVMEGRKFVKSRYEPFVITKIFDFDSNFLKVNVGPVNIYGLYKFARVGNITLAMINQTVDLRVRIITSKLYGKCDWYYDFGKIGITRHGQSNFSVDHLQFEAKIHQPVDSRRSPILEELEIELGPIIVKMDGLGGFDYIVERVVQLLPKLLRLMIIDALEQPVKEKIQTDVLDKINVEQVYEDNLADIKKYLSDKM